MTFSLVVSLVTQTKIEADTVRSNACTLQYNICGGEMTLKIADAPLMVTIVASVTRAGHGNAAAVQRLGHSSRRCFAIWA